MGQALLGNRWTKLTENNNRKQITDNKTIEKSTELKGYTEYVYKFGCALIHLSDFYNYAVKNPFDKLNYTEKFNIIRYLHQYHGVSRDRKFSAENNSHLIPSIFRKISKNMTDSFSAILNGKMIEI